MAGHDDSGKKSNENEIPTFNVENMQSNMKVIYYRSVFLLWFDFLQFRFYLILWCFLSYLVFKCPQINNLPWAELLLNYLWVFFIFFSSWGVMLYKLIL